MKSFWVFHLNFYIGISWFWICPSMFLPIHMQVVAVLCKYLWVLFSVKYRQLFLLPWPWPESLLYKYLLIFFFQFVTVLKYTGDFFFSFLGFFKLWTQLILLCRPECCLFSTQSTKGLCYARQLNVSVVLSALSISYSRKGKISLVILVIINQFNIWRKLLWIFNVVY